MSETIVLDTPEQINAWVLLSRRRQLHLHLKGIKVPGIVKWCKANIPAEYGKVTTAHNALQWLNDWMGDLGLAEDEWTTYTLYISHDEGNTYIEYGTHDTMAAVEEIYTHAYPDFDVPYITFRNLPKEAYQNG